MFTIPNIATKRDFNIMLKDRSIFTAVQHVSLHYPKYGSLHYV